MSVQVRHEKPVEGIVPMTARRREALRASLAQASGQMAAAIHRAPPPRQYNALRLLKTAVDAAQQVLDRSGADRI